MLLLRRRPGATVVRARERGKRENAWASSRARERPPLSHEAGAGSTSRSKKHRLTLLIMRLRRQERAAGGEERERAKTERASWFVCRWAFVALLRCVRSAPLDAGTRLIRKAVCVQAARAPRFGSRVRAKTLSACVHSPCASLALAGLFGACRAHAWRLKRATGASHTISSTCSGPARRPAHAAPHFVAWGRTICALAVFSSLPAALRCCCCAPRGSGGDARHPLPLSLGRSRRARALRCCTSRRGA